MSYDPDEESGALAAARDALEEEGPERALERLAAVAPEEPGRWVLEAAAWLELGEVERATEAQERARATTDAADPELRWMQAEIDLWCWRIGAARAAFEELTDVFADGLVLERLALCRELEGDFGAADALFARAHALDPDHHPLPPRLSPAEVEAIVEEAASDLPPPFREAFEHAAVVIDPMPTKEIVQAPASGHPPDVLGLYAGRPLFEYSQAGSGELPPTIFLFQRNLERLCLDHDALREEIRVTLYHELGHALGFDEDGVDDLGLA